MSVTRMLPNAPHFKEFYGGFHGTCGETALATAMICSQAHGSKQDAINLMLQMTKEMQGLGWADASGATSIVRLYNEAQRRKFSVARFTDYTQELDLSNLHDTLLALAGLKPIVIQVARAYALPGDEAGVHYHFICVVGITPQGYVCNDGDNWEIEQTLVTYSWEAIQAANPCGLLILDLQEGATPMGLPAGWTDDGSALHNPQNAFVVAQGFRDYILNNPWDAGDAPIENVQSVPEVEEFNTSHGSGTRQHFHFSQLSWTQKDGVFKTWLGDECLFLLVQLAKAPAPAPDPAVKTALSAALNLVSPSAALAAELQKALAVL